MRATKIAGNKAPVLYGFLTVWSLTVFLEIFRRTGHTKEEENEKPE